MEHQYYLPKTDTGKVIWLANFATVLGSYAAALNLAAGVVTAVQDDSAYFGFVFTLIQPFDEYSKTLTAYKNALRDGSPSPIGVVPVPPVIAGAPTLVLAGIFQRNADLVQSIKKNPAYTTVMGQNLGIIGAEINPDFATIQPQPKISLKNGHGYLTWKHEHTDAADIQVDHGDGAGFKDAGRILLAHYLDPTLPAAGTSKVFKYKIRYVVSDEEVGVWSTPIEITVTGF